MTPLLGAAGAGGVSVPTGFSTPVPAVLGMLLLGCAIRQVRACYVTSPFLTELSEPHRLVLGMAGFLRTQLTFVHSLMGLGKSDDLGATLRNLLAHR